MKPKPPRRLIRHPVVIKPRNRAEGTNYVIAAWTGPRRGDPHLDGSFYLREHIKSLQTYKHSLTQITVMVPANPNETKATADYINRLNNSKIQEARVCVVRRRNYGQSYGSWSDAFARYKQTVKYYIFIEDDYVFCMDDFDKKMIEVFNEFPKCGFMCAKAGTNGDMFPRHAMISNGITSSDVLQRIFDRYGSIPHKPKSTNVYCGYCQVRFSQAFMSLGYTLEDFTHRYRSPFFEAIAGGRLLEFAENIERKDYIIKPVQMVTRRPET